MIVLLSNFLKDETQQMPNCVADNQPLTHMMRVYCKARCVLAGRAWWRWLWMKVVALQRLQTPCLYRTSTHLSSPGHLHKGGFRHLY